MSIAALNWAMEQTGLKPAAKLVLICLADRHNKDTGECFPSQELLAKDACISRSSLNDQLAVLEERGFINRHPEIDPVTKRQKRTIYTFNAPFPKANPVSEIATRAVSENPGEPCPKKAESRVQNSDTNLVREPKDNPSSEQCAPEGGDLFEPMLAAVGLTSGKLPTHWMPPASIVHIERWRTDLGLSPEQILDCARQSRARHDSPPNGPKALDGAMQRYAAALAAAPLSALQGRAASAPPQRLYSLKAYGVDE